MQIDDCFGLLWGDGVMLVSKVLKVDDEIL